MLKTFDQKDGNHRVYLKKKLFRLCIPSKKMNLESLPDLQEEPDWQSIAVSPSRINSFSFSFPMMVTLLSLFFLLVIVLVFVYLYFPSEQRTSASKSSDQVASPVVDRHLLVRQEEAETFFKGEDVFASSCYESYLTDNVDEIAEDLELDGMAPTEKQVSNQLQRNMEENMQRLKRNLEFKWRGPVE